MRQEFKAQNIKCNGCVNSIKEGLSKVEGVEEVSVDKDTSIVAVYGEVSNETIVEELSNLGYPVTA